MSRILIVPKDDSIRDNYIWTGTITVSGARYDSALRSYVCKCGGTWSDAEINDVISAIACGREARLPCYVCFNELTVYKSVCEDCRCSIR